MSNNDFKTENNIENDIENDIENNNNINNKKPLIKSDEIGLELPTENSSDKICQLLCLTLSFIIIFIGAILYLIFGILYLVQDYDLANDCKGSNLWVYVLVAIVLSFSRFGSKNSNDENNNINICILFCLGLIEMGLAIWGGIELWDKSCENLKDSNLWKFGLATFCIQSFFSFLFVFVVPVLLCVLCSKLK